MHPLLRSHDLLRFHGSCEKLWDLPLHPIRKRGHHRVQRRGTRSELISALRGFRACHWAPPHFTSFACLTVPAEEPFNVGRGRALRIQSIISNRRRPLEGHNSSSGHDIVALKQLIDSRWLLWSSGRCSNLARHRHHALRHNGLHRNTLFLIQAPVWVPLGQQGLAATREGDGASLCASKGGAAAVGALCLWQSELQSPLRWHFQSICQALRASIKPWTGCVHRYQKTCVTEKNDHHSYGTMEVHKRGWCA